MHTDRHLGLDREKRGQITVTRGQQGYIALLPFCLRIMSLCVSIIHVQYTYIFNTLFFHKFFLFLRSSGMMPRYFFFLCAYQYHPRPHISPPWSCFRMCGRMRESVGGAVLAGACALRVRKMKKINKKIYKKYCKIYHDML